MIGCCLDCLDALSICYREALDKVIQILQASVADGLELVDLIMFR